MQGRDALDFLHRSMEFTHRVHAVTREAIAEGLADLWEMTRRADERLGPYPEFMTELGAGLRAHLATM